LAGHFGFCRLARGFGFCGLARGFRFCGLADHFGFCCASGFCLCGLAGGFGFCGLARGFRPGGVRGLGFYSLSGQVRGSEPRFPLSGLSRLRVSGSSACELVRCLAAFSRGRSQHFRLISGLLRFPLGGSPLRSLQPFV